MHNILRTLALTCAVTAAVGCGDQSDTIYQGFEFPEGPVALDDTLVFVDTANHQALLLDASAKQPTAEVLRAALPYGAGHAERRNGNHDEALVLCAGRRSTRDAQEEPAALSVISGTGKLRSYELGNTPFDSIVQSDDGAYAVLFRKEIEDGRVLSNSNQLAIVNLEAKPGKDAVLHRTPASFGHRPTSAVFSPLVRINEEDRRLLVVLSDAEVTLIDLDHPDRRETVVQLSGASGRSIAPAQVLWAADGAPIMYVRGAASDDVFMFRLEYRVPAGDQNDFRPSINQLGGGSGPSDMVLFTDDPDGDGKGDARLLVVSRGIRSAIVIDPNSSKASIAPLTAAAERVLLYTAASPKDTVVRTRAFIYAVGSDAVSFVDLEDIAERKARNVETLTLGSKITHVLPLLEDNRVVLLHADQGVSVLDLAQRTAVPISSSVTLDDALFDGVRERLWVAPNGSDRIGMLDLNTGATDELLLDTSIERLVPMFNAGRVVAVHRSSVGHVTFIDAKAPSRDTARSVRGFLLSDVLDRGAP